MKLLALNDSNPTVGRVTVELPAYDLHPREGVGMPELVKHVVARMMDADVNDVLSAEVIESGAIRATVMIRLFRASRSTEPV